MQYDIVITELSKEDGGGFLGYVPDLEGCMSDGETPEEALENTKAAITDWLSACSDAGRELPKPGSARKRAIEYRDRLVKILSEGIDGRLDELEMRILEIAENLEHVDDWNRFSRLTGVPRNSLSPLLPTGQADETA